MDRRNTLLHKIVRIGIDQNEQSLSDIKSTMLITRLCLISFLNLLFYSLILLFLGFNEQAVFCLLSLPVFILDYYLIYKKQINWAKVIYASYILILIMFFSVIFGKGIGTEFWIAIFGGVSLLIFKKRKNAFGFTIISIFGFIVIELIQWMDDPLIFLNQDKIQLVFQLNMVFIFLTTFMVSVVLRYSSEDFERRVQKQNALLQNKNKDLTDSINYARRIQKAILPSENMRSELDKNIFVLFEPKDIVSGDFYWIYRLKDKLLFAVVDGTGHGVSGALISIMAHAMLNQCVEEYALTECTDIVKQLKILIRERQERWNDQLADQMEITICAYDFQSANLSYATTGNVLYLIKHVSNVLPEDEISIETGDRYVLKEIRFNQSLRKRSLIETECLFGSHKFSKDDMIYLVTDGLANQFGGPKGKKLKSQRLKNLLMSVQHQNLSKQQYIIEDILVNWKGKWQSTDDITLLGFKV